MPLTVDTEFLREANRPRAGKTSPVRFVHKADGVHVFVKQMHLRFSDTLWREIVEAMEHVEKPMGYTEVPEEGPLFRT